LKTCIVKFDFFFLEKLQRNVCSTYYFIGKKILKKIEFYKLCIQFCRMVEQYSYSYTCQSANLTNHFQHNSLLDKHHLAGGNMPCCSYRFSLFLIPIFSTFNINLTMTHSYRWICRSVRQEVVKAGFMKALTLTVALLMSLGVYAQDRTVTGKVTDAADGSGIPGVTVSIKGTSKGTQTDASGAYKITVGSGTTLVFSSVGYINQEVAAGSRSVIDVALATDSKELEQVVVVGYGTVKKKDAIGAVSAIGAKDFNKGIVTSPEQLLQGRVPGVAITQNNGEPGGAINIRVRGTSSVVGNPNPLFVVDGVPLTDDGSTGGTNGSGLGSGAARNPLNFINPEDIASVDILKDASATAIYGSRGANGVVMITTKKGKSGRGGLEYNYSLGVSSITKRFNLLSASEFVAAGGANQNGSTDWQNELFRTAISQQHNIAYGGGDGSGSYRISLGYLDQQGIVKGSGLKRFSVSFNGNKKFINDKLTVGINLNTSSTADQAVPITDNSGFSGDLLAAVLKSNPTMSIYKADGVTFNQPGITEPNPLAILNFSKDNTNTIRALGNINAEIQLFKGLKFKTIYGFDRSISARKAALSRDLVVQDTQNVGRAYFSDIELDNTTWSNFFTYDKELSKNSFINATLGYEYQRFENYNKFSQATNFRTSNLDLMLNNVASANNQNGFGSIISNSGANTNELQSYFARVQGGMGNFLVNATVRIDGSTRFGGNNKYGTFPSVGAAWKLIDESFIPKDVFSDLKLRAAYGITGNQAIPHNLYQERQRYSGWGFNADATQINGGGINTVAFANPDLKWEQTAQWNIGLDFALKSGRVSGSIELYNRKTTNLLIPVNSAQPAAQPFVWKNLDANIYNRGVEIGLTVLAVDSKDFSWEIMANGAFNTNKVEDFNGIIDTGGINGQGLTGAFAQRIATGQPLYAWFLREFDGYDENGVTKYVGADAQKFLDGKSPLPTFTGGLTNNLKYKNFDLNFFFNIVQGNYIYSNNANAFWTKGSFANGRNVTRDVPASKEGPLNAPDVSTRFLEDGSFIRLQNLTLGYRVPVSSKSAIAGLRLFLTGQNLLTITNYSGQDPEVNTNKSLNGFNSFGIDYTAYPRARTWTIGANITF
jgi:TonB-dependent starch-binding outer membrane protein SusC